MTKRVLVVGAGIGGLTAGSLLAKEGYDVTVLEAAAELGGCAGKYQRKPYLFPVGATLGMGLEPGGIHERVFRHLEKPMNLEPLERVMEMVHPAGKTDAIERFLGPHRVLRNLGHQRNVLARGQHRDQVVGLEHEADLVKPEAGELALSQSVDTPVGEPDLAAVDPVEATDGVEERRLAAAGGRRETHEASLPDLEADVVEALHLELALTVGLAHVDTAHSRHGHTFVMASTGS